MNLPPASHPWKIPVHIVPPTNGDAIPVVHWKDLSFSPIGLYHLRRWLGAYPGHRNLFSGNQPRFRSADLAWFASGTHNDGNHYRQPRMFHPSFLSLHQATSRDQRLKEERKEVVSELQDLVFDSAALWDRVSGGTTMVIHVNGTTMPGAPIRPEYLKAHVYMPPSLIEQHPVLQQPIQNIVQSFLETVGIQTVEDWMYAARKQLGYSLAYNGRSPFPNPSYHGFPRPKEGSAHYIFLGQPVSSSAPSGTSIPLVPSGLTPPPSPSSESSLSYDLQDDYDILHNKYEALMQEVVSLRRDKEQLASLNSKLSAELQNTLSQLQLHEVPRTPSPQVFAQRAPLRDLPHVSTPTHRVVPPNSPNVTLRNSKTKSSSHLSSAKLHAPFGFLNRSGPTTFHAQSPPSSDPFNDIPYKQHLASGSNSYNYDISAPRLNSNVPTLHLLLRTLDLLHLKEQISLVHEYVPSEKQMLELMGMGITQDVAQKIVYCFASDPLLNSLDFA